MTPSPLPLPSSFFLLLLLLFPSLFPSPPFPLLDTALILSLVYLPLISPACDDASYRPLSRNPLPIAALVSLSLPPLPFPSF
jgi:hypothetical protein